MLKIVSIVLDIKIVKSNHKLPKLSKIVKYIQGKGKLWARAKPNTKGQGQKLGQGQGQGQGQNHKLLFIRKLSKIFKKMLKLSLGSLFVWQFVKSLVSQ